MSTSAPVTVVALMNAMIGGTILVLPILYLQAGLIPSFLITILTCLINYYSCKVCLDHLKDDIDIPQCIFRHTRKMTFPKIYDVFVYVDIQFILLLYFDLLAVQWETILGLQTKWIGIGCAILVILLIFIMRKYHWGVALLGYGGVSIGAYMVFLIWAFLDIQVNPSDSNNKYPVFTWNIAVLCGTLASAFNLQGVFVPILRKNENQRKNDKLLWLSYVFACLTYAIIGYVGSFAILNRKPLSDHPQTVENYFPTNNWQVKVIASIYLVHLLSAFPQFLLISKTRFFSLFGAEETKRINWKDVAYILLSVLVFLTFHLSGISISTILSINGAILGFAFIYVLPLGIHLKCVYFPENVSNESSESMEINQQAQDRELLIKEKSCLTIRCGEEQTKREKTKHGLLMFGMLSFGIAVMVYTVYSLFN